ncbi:SDR family NAD(P)-dependent oxidoreductase [Pseudomonadota bacterium]
MDLGIKGKVALITGGSSGIGFSTAHNMAQEGAHIFIIARSQENIERAKTRLENETGSKVSGMVADMGDNSQPAQIVNRCIRDFGRLDILINNAGRAQVGGLLQTEPEQWQSMVEVKLYALVECCRAALPIMQENGWGRIVNISSVGGIYPTPKLMISHVVSAAINNLTKSLALEVAHNNVLVNAIGVGAVTTDNWKKNVIANLRKQRPDWDSLSDEDMLDRLGKEKTPLGRFGKPEEIARLATFLASEANGFVTGATIEASGGADRFI